MNIRQRNAEKILAVLKQKGPSSRAAIAQALSLSVASISTQVSEMLDKGMLCELQEDQTSSKPGKNGRLVAIRFDYAATVGCHIGDERAYAGMADLGGNVLYAAQPVDFDPTKQGDVLAAVFAVLDDVLQHTQNLLPLGIGVSVNNELLHSVRPDGAVLPQLRDAVARQYPFLKVIAQTASRAMALAEIDYGSCRCVSNMMFLQVANSLDLAMVINGELYGGAHNRSGWLDHVVIDPEGEWCECGKRGCVKTVMTVSGILNRVRKIYSQENTPALYRLTGGDPGKLQYDHLKLASAQGDLPVAMLYGKDDKLFSSLLFNFAHIIDPECVVIQGIGLYADEFITRLNWQVRRMPGAGDADIYRLSMLKEDNIFLGGNAITARWLFYGQLHTESEV